MTKKFKGYLLTYPKSIYQIIEDNLIQNNIKPKVYLLKYLYVINIICYQKIFEREDSQYQKYGIAINLKVLSNQLSTDNQTTSKILNNLMKWGIIKLVSKYEKGIRSNGYKLCSKYDKLELNANFHFSKTKTFLDKVIKENYSKKRDSVATYVKKVYERYVTLSPKGKEYLFSKYDGLEKFYNNVDSADRSFKVETMDIPLLKFLFGMFKCNRNKKNKRIYSNITNLNKDFRKYINIDEQSIVYTDITNSQMLFSVFYLENYLRKTNRESFIHSEDFQAYKNDCISGVIYDNVAKLSRKVDLLKNDRTKFKQLFLKEVGFSDIGYKDYQGEKKFKRGTALAFNKLYPETLKLINEVKRKYGYKNYPLSLQRLESRMIIDSICKELIKHKILFLTIHDSIVVNNNEDLKFVEHLLLQKFRVEYNCTPHFKSEYKEDSKRVA